MSLSNAARCLVIVVTLAAISGCGFRLQGADSLPPEFAATYIDTEDRYTPFYRALTKALRERGATVVRTEGASRAVINILGDAHDQVVTAVSSRNTPLEYEAFYSVTFSAAVDGRTVLESDSITLTNRYEFDDTKVLGKAAEFDRFSDSQAADIARQVMVQLSTL